MLPRGQTVLFAASGGGHLLQSIMLADELRLRSDSLWVTFDSPQSRSLLEGRRVEFFPDIPPRAYGAAALALPRFLRLLGRESFEAVLSTGAAIAAPALLAAALRSVSASYVESVSRFDGPSLTGRVLQHVPRVRCYTQHQAWEGGRWSYDRSVLDSLMVRGGPATGELAHDRPARVFVTLGTIRPFRFDALVDNLLRVLPEGTDVDWQLGCTGRTDLPGRSSDVLPAEDFDRLATEADLVITHGGVGSALRLLQLGVAPLVVPRRRARGEHIDDHQVQMAREFERSGLLHVCEAGAITTKDLVDLLPKDSVA